MTRYAVIGGGIVGLATAYELTRSRPHATVVVLEKEDRVAGHQTGHNSGVIHSGLYYRPGSLKANLCRAGAAAMVEFCSTMDIPVRVCGKLVVATSETERPRLTALHQRALANGLPVALIGADEAREHEPAVAAVAALHVPGTATVDFGQVCRVLADLVEAAGGTVRLNAEVTAIRQVDGGARTVIETTRGEVVADYLVNCAGLHADRVARMAGLRPPAQIVPFRGEYYELRPDRRDLVRGLIYPVPDPRFPFLGVHLTRMIDGSVHAGPNAVLALAREGYSWGRVRWGDLVEAIRFPGLWRLARRHLRYGLTEVHRSLSTAAFARDLARLVPALTRHDIVRAGAGVRAQAITDGGDLVDDFLFTGTPSQVHVINAPSPAATSSLAIARHIVSRLPG
jgi:L-2-hydroxyglutarate oxidase